MSHAADHTRFNGAHNRRWHGSIVSHGSFVYPLLFLFNRQKITEHRRMGGFEFFFGPASRKHKKNRRANRSALKRQLSVSLAHSLAFHRESVSLSCCHFPPSLRVCSCLSLYFFFLFLWRLCHIYVRFRAKTPARWTNDNMGRPGNGSFAQRLSCCCCRYIRL